MIYTLIGPPLAGKSKVGDEISKRLNVDYINVGENVRSLLKYKDSFYDEYNGVVSRGDLIDDDVIITIVESLIQDTDDFIIDGFPRNENQAIWFSEYLSSRCQKVNNAIFLSCSQEEMERRISKRILKGTQNGTLRADDSIKVLKNRIDNYNAITYPQLYLYYNYEDVLDIDTSVLSIDEVLEEIYSSLDTQDDLDLD